MQLTVHQQGNQADVKVGGDIVASIGGDFQQGLLDLCRQGVTHLALDLADVSLVDSFGIGALIATHNHLKKTGGTLRLLNVNADIRKMFSIMRLDRHFAVEAAP